VEILIHIGDIMFTTDLPYDIITLFMCSITLNIILAIGILREIAKNAEIQSDLERIKKIINKKAGK